MRFSKDIFLSSILSCLWAVQMAVITQQVLGIWHPPVLLQNTLLPEASARMAPKWDLMIYFIFIISAVMGQMILVRSKQGINGWLLIFESALTFLMVSTVFKMLVYFDSPELAHRALMALIGLALAGKVFYPELKKAMQSIYRRVSAINWQSFADAWWVLTIFLLIYMPDLQRVMALAFIGDWLHHFDFMEMSVGWAVLWGQLPYVDIISQYGVGLPIIFAKITHVLGGFDYVPVLNVMMWFVIGYFLAAYFFVRHWLGSALMAGVAFLLAFRLQMFHFGVSPLVWITPSACPVRFGLDVLWMWALLMHLRTAKTRWLAAAAIYSGFAVYYMTSVGMCAVAALYVYLLGLALSPLLRNQYLGDAKQRLIFYASWALPAVSTAVFFALTLKGHILHKEYWHNLLDYMVVFGHTGAMPMWESLKYRHFWAFIMSMVMPLTYVGTLLYAAACLYLGKGPAERLILVLLSVYGLGNYQYYVVRAAITSYYVDALPFILIVCYWFMRGLEFFPILWQKRLKAAAVVLSFYALLTNQNYLAYPNLLNVSRNPMTDNLVIQRFPDRTGFFNNQYRKVKEADKLPVNDLDQTNEDMRTEDDFKNDRELTDYFHRHFNFQQDAALIDRLTKPGERVALLSSFETKILIEAKRPPYFYHFPMLASRPMSFRDYPSDAAHTPAYLPDTFRAFQQRPPEYVFMEKVFLEQAVPPSERVAAVIAYVKARYKPFAYGQYLTAMKRQE